MSRQKEKGKEKEIEAGLGEQCQAAEYTLRRVYMGCPLKHPAGDCSRSYALKLPLFGTFPASWYTYENKN